MKEPEERGQDASDKAEPAYPVSALLSAGRKAATTNAERSLAVGEERQEIGVCQGHQEH